MKDESFYQYNRTDPKYIYIDASENAIDSLETVNFFFKRNDNLKWKWIALSLHHSLYMFCVLNLEGGNYNNVVGEGINDDLNTFMLTDGVWKRSKIKKWDNSPGYEIYWEAIEGEPKISSKGKKQKSKKLINFWTALARVQDSENYMHRYVFSKPITLSDSEKNSIEWLTNQIRNNLAHFIPMGLGIPIADIKKSSLDILNVIYKLAFETRQVIYYEPESKERVEKALREAKENIKNA